MKIELSEIETNILFSKVMQSDYQHRELLLLSRELTEISSTDQINVKQNATQ